MSESNNVIIFSQLEKSVVIAFEFWTLQSNAILWQSFATFYDTKASKVLTTN